MAIQIILPPEDEPYENPWEEADSRVCDGCGEAILGGESFYLLPDGYFFCENCISDMRHTA